MSKFLSIKIKWKNVALGAGLGVLLMILALLVVYYVTTYLPSKETEKQLKRLQFIEDQMRAAGKL